MLETITDSSCIWTYFTLGRDQCKGGSERCSHEAKLEHTWWMNSWRDQWCDCEVVLQLEALSARCLVCKSVGEDREEASEVRLVSMSSRAKLCVGFVAHEGL